MSFHIPHVVIVGGGFAGLHAAKTLKHSPVRITLVDRRNHHLFQPLLYQVASASLSPAQIAAPIRHILNKQKNVAVLLDHVRNVDLARQTIQLNHSTLSYDYLLLCAGARHSYFGNDHWESHAPGLKSLEDALELRKRILAAFEEAERLADPEERRAALTFIVVGAGPTGVEMAGAIAEVARFTLVKDFRRINPRDARIILIEAGPRILPTFHESLSKSALRQLHQLGVEVQLSSLVKDVNEQGVLVGDVFIRAKTIVWAAGNAAAPLTQSLGVPLDRAGRILVEPDLSLPGYPNAFAAGDIAVFKHGTTQPVPAVCPAAMQMGAHAAHNIRRSLRQIQTKPFSYFDKGSMATIGRNAAVADIRGIRFSGFPAWLGWLFVHLIFLVGFRNRLVVLLEWAWAYFTYQKGARLITNDTNDARKSPATDASTESSASNELSARLLMIPQQPVHQNI